MTSNFDTSAFSPSMQRILSNAEKAYYAINKNFINCIPMFNIIVQYASSLKNALQTIPAWDNFFQQSKNCAGITSDIFIQNHCENRILLHSTELYSDVTELVIAAYKEQTRAIILERLYQDSVKFHDRTLLAFIADQELLSDTLKPFNSLPNIYKGSMCYVTSVNMIVSTLTCCMICEETVGKWEKDTGNNPIFEYIDEHYEKYGWFNIITMAKNTFSDCCFQCQNDIANIMLNNSDIFGLIIYFYKFPIKE